MTEVPTDSSSLATSEEPLAEGERIDEIRTDPPFREEAPFHVPRD